jgi:gliding motility-associated lipoprotein GldD
MKKFTSIIIFSCIFFGISCRNEVLPKPKAFLKLEYPANAYKQLNTACNFDFEISKNAKVTLKDNCWLVIEYPKLKATIYITYRPVRNNLEEILKEVEKLTFEHTVKANAIQARPYENFDKKVFAKLYSLEGNVATNIQFRATDSLKHVLSGALYFYAKPNYDSIRPALKYLEKDIIHLVETLEWQ